MMATCSSWFVVARVFTLTPTLSLKGEGVLGYAFTLTLSLWERGLVGDEFRIDGLRGVW